jgi:hypothetical protein
MDSSPPPWNDPWRPPSATAIIHTRLHKWLNIFSVWRQHAYARTRSKRKSHATSTIFFFSVTVFPG